MVDYWFVTTTTLATGIQQFYLTAVILEKKRYFLDLSILLYSAFTVIKIFLTFDANMLLKIF